MKRGLSKGDKGLTDACCVFDGHHKKHSEGGRLEPEFNGWLGFKKRSCV